MDILSERKATCPGWCPRDHRSEWRNHTREIAVIENPFTGDAVTVAVAQYGDNHPQVSVALDGREKSTVTYLSPGEASAIADALALGQAERFVAGLTDAAGIVGTEDGG